MKPTVRLILRFTGSLLLLTGLVLLVAGMHAYADWIAVPQLQNMHDGVDALSFTVFGNTAPATPVVSSLGQV